MGLQTQEAAKFMCQHYSLPVPWEELAQQQRANTEKLMRHSQLMPGTPLPPLRSALPPRTWRR